MSTDEWNWRIEWCMKKGLSPADNDNWELAGKAYLEQKDG